MRVVAGFLLALLCLPGRGAPGQVLDLAGLASVPVRIFDLRADNAAESFHEFMLTVPMTNDRRVPAALVADTVASLSFVKAATPPQMPAYFVAAYIHKTPLVATPDSDRTRYLERYGEVVYPQRVCPVFISRAEAGVPQMLSAATNLPTAWFRRTGGGGETLDRLFALTEISHCGFIAGELANPTVLPAGLDKKELRAILEALGDLEATAVFRGPAGESRRLPDAADRLFAARLAAMFFLDKENAYTPLPGLVHEYRRIGVAETHRKLPRVFRSVRLARRIVREQLRIQDGPAGRASLASLRTALDAARAEGRLATGDRLADQLVATLGPAIGLLEGDGTRAVFPAAPGRDDDTKLITLAGTPGRM